MTTGGDGTARLLVVEDDEQSLVALVRAMERHGYDVLTAVDGPGALAVAARERVDLVLLDIGLPRIDGFAVLSRLRRTSDVPVIVLTARAEEVDRVVGLELGADDYVVKPFSLRELVARVRARLRRPGLTPTGPPPPPESDPAPGAAERGATERGATAVDRPPDGRLPEQVHHGDLHIDTRAHEVHVRGHRVDLTAREYELLAFFAAHPRTVFTREALLERVWGTRFQDPATVTEHVRRLRAKVEAMSPTRQITTLRGTGYRFDP